MWQKGECLILKMAGKLQHSRNCYADGFVKNFDEVKVCLTEMKAV